MITDAVDVTCYDIGDNRILTTLQKGWKGFQLLQFLLKQPMVSEVEWNQHKYKPGDVVPDDFDEFQEQVEVQQKKQAAEKVLKRKLKKKQRKSKKGGKGKRGKKSKKSKKE